MAMTTTTALTLAALAASAGMQYHNTTSTARRADQEAARGIATQGRIQREADSTVNAAVDKLEGSTAADEKARRMGDYMQTIERARRVTNRGLDTDAFGEDYAEAAGVARGNLAAKGAERATLMAGVDAPGLQRQGEAFDLSRLATDLGLIGRESSGQDWLTNLRLSGVRRRPGLDAGAALLQGLAGGMASGAGAAPAAARTSPMAFSNDQLLAAMRYGMGGA